MKVSGRAMEQGSPAKLDYNRGAREQEDPVLGRARRVLEFIHEYIDDEGVSPTIREIGEGCRIRGMLTLYDVLEELEMRGCIRRRPKTPRGIQVLEEECLEESGTV